MNDKAQPCQKRLDADCFRHNPAWAKRAFAYRLVHLLTPKQLTRRLPKGLRLALIAPGVIIPPGLVLPDGALVGPGTDLPSTWTPGDPVPPGIIIDPGTTFPPDWAPGDPAPDGVTIDPGATFPPGWNPGDPAPDGVTIDPGATFPPGWNPPDPVPDGVAMEPGATFPPEWNPPDPVPEGLYPTPALPPAAVATGPTPPTYVAPVASEPTSQPGRVSPSGCPDPAFAESFAVCTYDRIATEQTHTPFPADLGTWYAYLYLASLGTNQVITQVGYIEPQSGTITRWNLVYIPDSDTFNIRCATTIKIRSRRTGGGGLKCKARIYDAQPPGGNVLFSYDLTFSSSYQVETIPIGLDLSGYDDLHFAIYTHDGRKQRILEIDIY